MSESLDSILNGMFNTQGKRFFPGDDEATIAAAVNNTLGIDDRRYFGVVEPTCVEEIIALVRIAKEQKVSLRPVSTGLNIGYGDMMPTADHQLLVRLHRMNDVKLDTVDGYASIEPGVTQIQLFEALQETEYVPDGWGVRHGSKLGQSLDGGAGHSPMGNPRLFLDQVQAVLGTGELIKLGETCDLGPNLNPLFVQSNLGIVTRGRVKLNRKPEYSAVFYLKLDSNEELQEAVNAVRDLRQAGTLTSQVHFFRSDRLCEIVKEIPPERRGEYITPEIARDIVGKPRVGYWNVFGGLFGSKGEVSAKARQLKKRLGEYGQIIVLSQGLLEPLEKYADRAFRLYAAHSPRQIEIVNGYYGGIKNLGMFLKIQNGVPPPDITLRRWKYDRDEQKGLTWVAPSFSVQYAGQVLAYSDGLCREAGIEGTVALIFHTDDLVVATYRLNFDRTDKKQRHQALQLSRDILIGLHKNFGAVPYRLAVPNHDLASRFMGDKADVFDQIKQRLDPDNVIAPGLYGFG